MNNFVISVGAYITSMNSTAMAAGDKIGLVSVDMGKTACKVPMISVSLQKVIDRGSVGKKRKSARA